MDYTSAYKKKSMLDDTLLDVLRMEQLRSLQFTDCLHMDTFSVTLCKALQHNGANLENKKGIIIIGSLILGCLNTHTHKMGTKTSHRESS